MIKNANPLTEAQLRDLARELAVQLARVERRLALVDDGAPADEPSEGQASLHKEREQVTSALDRMASGRYGQCLDCGASLGFGRLIMQPELDLCSSCASRV